MYLFTHFWMFRTRISTLWGEFSLLFAEKSYRKGESVEHFDQLALDVFVNITVSRERLRPFDMPRERCHESRILDFSPHIILASANVSMIHNKTPKVFCQTFGVHCRFLACLIGYNIYGYSFFVLRLEFNISCTMGIK